MCYSLSGCVVKTVQDETVTNAWDSGEGHSDVNSLPNT